MSDFTTIKNAALLESERLLAQWMPDGKQHGREWLARNPMRADSRPGSFSVNLDSGKYYDYASGCHGGNLLDLYKDIHGCNAKDAALALASDLGLSGLQIQGGTSTPEQQAANALLREDAARKAEERRQAAQAVEQHQQGQAAAFARQAWDQAAPAGPEHPYLQAKGVKPHGVRVVMGDMEDAGGLRVRKDELLIPLHDEAGQLVGLQRIAPNGQKRFLKGARMQGTRYRIDGKAPAYIAEGYATAASVHEATGHAVYVALNAGNMQAVASTVTDAGYVAADNDSHKQSTGEKAARATGLPYAMPPEPGDWNDYASRYGLKATEQALQTALQQVAPPIPEQLAPDMDKPDPYPVETLPEIMRDAVRAIAEIVQCPVALAGQSVLSAAAYLAQTRSDALSPVKYQMPCSLYMLALADSGDRKSTADKLASKPIAEREQEKQNQFRQARKDWEQAKQGMKSAEEKEFIQDNPAPNDPSTLITSDASYSKVASMLINDKPALFWATDEGGQMLGGHSIKADNRAAVLGGLTKVFDDGSLERVRSSDNADGSGRAYNRRLSISLLAQEITVRDALNDPVLRGQGFLPRFLFTAPESLKGTRLLTMDRLIAKPADDARLSRYWQHLQHLMAKPEQIDSELLEVNTERMDWTQDARQTWLDFYNSTEGEQGRFGRYAEMTPFASRAGELAARVATILAFFCERDHVDGETMRGAVALVNHSLNEWLRYAAVVRVDAVTDGAIKCIDWLVKQVQDGKAQWLEFSADTWGKSGYQPFRGKAKRDPVFSVLVNKGHLLQSGKTYRINPQLLQDQAGHSAESAESAGSPVNTGFAVADEVRKTAEKVRTESPAQEIRKTSAPIRKTSATANPHEQRASALSALSAPVGQWEGCRI